jgi:hypothetical protein
MVSVFVGTYGRIAPDYNHVTCYGSNDDKELQASLAPAAQHSYIDQFQYRHDMRASLQ